MKCAVFSDGAFLTEHMLEGDGVETWTRDFAGRRFKSRLSRRGPLLVERFGPLRFGFDLLSDDRGLSMNLKRWWLGPMSLPVFLAPYSPAREWEENGIFHFDVPISLPIVGLVVRYRGWLRPPTETSSWRPDRERPPLVSRDD